MSKKILLILLLISIPLSAWAHIGDLSSEDRRHTLNHEFFKAVYNCDTYYDKNIRHDNNPDENYIAKIENGGGSETDPYAMAVAYVNGKCIVKVHNKYSNGSYVCQLPIDVAQDYGKAGENIVYNELESLNSNLIKDDLNLLKNVHNNSKLCKKERFNITFNDITYNYDGQRNFYSHLKKCDGIFSSTSIPNGFLNVIGKTKKDNLCVIREKIEKENYDKICKLPMDIAGKYAREGLISIDKVEEQIIETNGNITHIKYKNNIPQKTKYMKEIIENAKYCHDTTNDENERYGKYPNKYSIVKYYKQKLFKISRNILEILGIIFLIIVGIGSIKRAVSKNK